MYAIIATGGKQYKVAEGDVIKVERLGAAAGEAVTFDQVLAVNNGEMKIGCPTVEGATVSATVVKEGKGKKVIVYKYKRKTGYHKKNGHRQLFTEVKIEKINATGVEVKGHAGYDEYGKDIVCAAVSVLTVNMANSVEKFTDDGFKGSVDEKTGQFIFHFTGTVSAESKLLMDSLILGLTDIAESYGDKYIKIRFREV